MIGGEQTISLQDRQVSDIQYWIQQDGINHSDLPSVASSYGMGEVFRTGEYVTLRDTVDDSREWLLETTMFIVYGPDQGRYYFFVDENYFISKSRASTIETDDWTGQPVLV